MFVIADSKEIKYWNRFQLLLEQQPRLAEVCITDNKKLQRFVVYLILRVWVDAHRINEWRNIPCRKEPQFKLVGDDDRLSNKIDGAHTLLLAVPGFKIPSASLFWNWQIPL